MGEITTTNPKGASEVQPSDKPKVGRKKNADNPVEQVKRDDYNKLMKKYREQQKMLNALKAEEKLALREKFKNLSPTGRRRKYTPLKMKNKIIDYFATIQAQGKPPTKSGLMVHLKMHRDQFYAYATYPEFRDIMEQTSQMMENWYEESLLLNRYNNSGIQFALKNRFGWTDTQTIKHEEISNEENLIRRIEALAPDLAGFFQRSNQAALQISDNREAASNVIDVDFSDREYEERGNE